MNRAGAVHNKQHCSGQPTTRIELNQVSVPTSFLPSLARLRLERATITRSIDTSRRSSSSGSGSSSSSGSGSSSSSRVRRGARSRSSQAGQPCYCVEWVCVWTATTMEVSITVHRIPHVACRMSHVACRMHADSSRANSAAIFHVTLTTRPSATNIRIADASAGIRTGPPALCQLYTTFVQ